MSIVRQRGILKLYLIKMIEQQRAYGLSMMNELIDEFAPVGYRPSHDEIYKMLQEMEDDGMIRRQERYLKGDPELDRRRVVVYQLTEQGVQQAETFRKQIKINLDFSFNLINKALKDHF